VADQMVLVYLGGRKKPILAFWENIKRNNGLLAQDFTEGKCQSASRTVHSRGR